VLRNTRLDMLAGDQRFSLLDLFVRKELYRIRLQFLEVVVGDEVGGDGSAEAQDGGGDDDSGRRLDGVDDRSHRQRQDELGQKDHAGSKCFL
jgi:hypothetical protein